MARVLVVYATRYGQTERIAARVAAGLERAGHAVRLAAVGTRPDVGDEDLCVIGAPIYASRYSRAVRRWARRHASRLAGRPVVFFSVSLAAASQSAPERGQVLALAERFAGSLRVPVAAVASLAGALCYTRYPWFLRWGLRSIARREGGPTDTSRDHELTDWDEVERFTSELLARLGAGAGQGRADGAAPEEDDMNASRGRWAEGLVLVLTAVALAVIGLAPGHAVAEPGAMAAPDASAGATKAPATVVHLSHGTDDLHRVTMALKLAHAMAARGDAVVLFVDLEGVRVADRRVSGDLRWGTGAPFGELYRELVEAGGRVLVCPHCAEAAGLDASFLREGAEIVPVEQLAEVLSGAARILDY